MEVDNTADAMQTLFSKLDEAIDDMENGRVILEEEMWAELDAILMVNEIELQVILRDES